MVELSKVGRETSSEKKVVAEGSSHATLPRLSMGLKELHVHLPPEFDPNVGSYSSPMNGLGCEVPVLTHTTFPEIKAPGCELAANPSPATVEESVSHSSHLACISLHVTTGTSVVPCHCISLHVTACHHFRPNASLSRPCSGKPKGTTRCAGTKHGHIFSPIAATAATRWFPWQQREASMGSLWHVFGSAVVFVDLLLIGWF